MRVLYLAGKDLRRASRSAFLWIMMFAVPAGLSALMYVAFGGAADGDEPRVSLTTVIVADEDAGSPRAAGFRGGAIVEQALRAPELADLLAVSTVEGATAARAAVDAGEAGVAVLVPADFTAALIGEAPPVTLTVYQDPALRIGPAIVRSVVRAVLDRLGAGAVAAEALRAQFAEAEMPLSAEEQAAARRAYEAALSARETAGAPPLVAFRNLPPAEQRGGLAVMGPIVAGQMLFAAFFAAISLAQTLLLEEEEGTLARLFTTATPPWAVLAGKGLAAAILVVGQTVVLMVGSHLAIGLDWGSLASLALLEAGLVLGAPGFGLFLMSLARTTRQSGVLLGAGLTLSSALGGLFTAGVPGLPAALDVVRLFFPQGWAIRGWQKALAGAAPAAVWTDALVLALFGLGLFAAGAQRFRQRYARGCERCAL